MKGLRWKCRGIHEGDHAKMVRSARASSYESAAPPSGTASESSWGDDLTLKKDKLSGCHEYSATRRRCPAARSSPAGNDAVENSRACRQPASVGAVGAADYARALVWRQACLDSGGSLRRQLRRQGPGGRTR